QTIWRTADRRANRLARPLPSGTLPLGPRCEIGASSTRGIEMTLASVRSLGVWPGRFARFRLWIAAAFLVMLTGTGWAGEHDPLWHQEEGYRWAELAHPPAGQAGFLLMPAAVTGIVFTNRVDELSLATNRVLGNGSGVAVGDYDGDGLPDLFFC